MEFVVLNQKPGESPGLMEVYGFYFSEAEAWGVVTKLKTQHVMASLYRLCEPPDETEEPA